MKELALKILNQVNSSVDSKITISLLGLHLAEGSSLFDSHIDFDYLDSSPFFNTVKDATYYTLNEASFVELVEILLSLDNKIEIETHSVFNYNTVEKGFRAPMSKSLRRLLKESRISITKK
jgi:hypothetical protein